MNAPHPTNLETFINDALAGEPLRPVPPGLHRRIETRLHIAAMIAYERRRFRQHMAAGAALLSGTFGVVFLAGSMLDLEEWLAWSIPGGMGYFDYVTVSAANTWAVWVGSSALWFGAMAAVLAFIAAPLLPRWAAARAR